MDQTEYWDKAALNKEFTTPFHNNLFRQYVSVDKRILDVGCGYGRTLNELKNYGYNNLTGIDISEEMLKRGTGLYPSINFQMMSDNEIPFKKEQFDAVILFAVLTCIINDKKQFKLINEIKRVLKPNGIIYINDFLLNNDKRNIDRYKEHENEFNNYGVFRLKEGAVLRHHSREWIVKIKMLFKEIEYKEVTYKTMNGNLSRGFVYLGKKNK